MPNSFKRTTLIADFDNTLYDWFDVWHRSFSAMLGEIVKISGISKEDLIPEIRLIHQKYRTSEYAFLIEEIPLLRTCFPDERLELVFDDAIHAYRRARKSALKLYDGVREALLELRSGGVEIVLYTESLAYYTNYRVRRLELDQLIDFIYSPPDHELPSATVSHEKREDVRLAHAVHRYLPEGVVKPDPMVLKDIVQELNRKTSECVYVGDSLMKDIKMAQDAGVLDVFAEYGGVQSDERYELLRQVSHWTDADVAREKATSKMTIVPSHSISHFGDIKRFF